jgi:hypothetical protein
LILALIGNIGVAYCIGAQQHCPLGTYTAISTSPVMKKLARILANAHPAGVIKVGYISNISLFFFKKIVRRFQ